MWAARALASDAAGLPLFDHVAGAGRRDEPDANLPPMPVGEHVVNDYRYLSLSLKAHPLSFLRPRLAARGIVDNAALIALAPAMADEIVRLREALRGLLNAYEPEEGVIDCHPDGGCIECTSGVTPNHLNTGLCAYHRARAALGDQ